MYTRTHALCLPHFPLPLCVLLVFHALFFSSNPVVDTGGGCGIAPAALTTAPAPPPAGAIAGAAAGAGGAAATSVPPLSPVLLTRRALATTRTSTESESGFSGFSSQPPSPGRSGGDTPSADAPVFGSWCVKRHWGALARSRQRWRWMVATRSSLQERRYKGTGGPKQDPIATVPLSDVSHVAVVRDPAAKPSASPFAWPPYVMQVWTVDAGSDKSSLKHMWDLTPVCAADLQTWRLVFDWLDIRVLCVQDPLNELCMTPTAVADTPAIVATPLSSSSSSGVVNDSASPLAAALATVPLGAPIADTTFVLRVHLPDACGFLMFVVDTDGFARTTADALAGVQPPTVQDVVQDSLTFLQATCPLLSPAPDAPSSPGAPLARKARLVPFAACLPRNVYGRADAAGGGGGGGGGVDGAGAGAGGDGCDGTGASPTAAAPSPRHLACLRAVVARGASRFSLRCVPSGDFLLETAPLANALWLRSCTGPVDAHVPGRPNGCMDVALVAHGSFSGLSVSVPYHVPRLDSFGKPYKAFCLTVAYNGVEWDTDQRHSTFQTLLRGLAVEHGNGPFLPPFPKTGHRPAPLPPRLPLLPKSDKRLTLEQARETEFLERRRVKLERMLQQLLSLPACCDNVPILSWLGVLSTTRHEVVDSPVVHLSKVGDFCRPGDVILFSCKGVLQGLQRTVTRSSWDHVGIVVNDPASRQLHLLEVNGDGVGCYPLVWRLKCYGVFEVWGG